MRQIAALTKVKYQITFAHRNTILFAGVTERYTQMFVWRKDQALQVGKKENVKNKRPNNFKFNYR